MASYVYGNTVRKEMNQQASTAPVLQPKEVSKRVQTNRSNALHMSRGYVMFLAVAAVVALLACVQYLQLQSEVTSRSKNITSLQQELANAKEANTTKYNAIVNSMNLEEIRERAMTDLGMVYASTEQVIEYESPSNQMVKKYADIPESGMLASSDKVK